MSNPCSECNAGSDICVDIAERIKSTYLHVEKAIVLSRAGKCSEALQVLVHQEKDLQAAEAFCSRAARGQGSQSRPALLLSLLQIYLRSEQLASAAVDLLNDNPQVFEAETLVRLLPDSWSVQLVSRFLVGSLREALHRRRMARLQTALSQAELMRHKVIRVSLMATLTSFTAVCIVCVSIFPLCLSSTDSGFKDQAQTG